MTTRLLLAASLVALLATASTARADTSTEVIAEELFREGKRLMGEGRFAEACPKLAESQRLDPGGGTLLALGLCHEGEGRTASAWAELKDARSAARREGRKDRIEVVDARLAALEPRLARIRVKVPDGVANDASLVIRLDGLDYPRAAWGISLPVDPGRHVVEATATRHAPLRIDVYVPDEPRTTDVEVAELAEVVPLVELPAPAAPKEPATGTLAPNPQASSTDHRPRWALPASAATGAAGLGALTVGIGFAIRAASLAADADTVCPSSECASPGAIKTSRDAGTSADVATVAFAFSGTLVAASIVLYVVSRAQRDSPRGGASLAPLLLRF